MSPVAGYLAARAGNARAMLTHDRPAGGATYLWSRWGRTGLTSPSARRRRDEDFDGSNQQRDNCGVADRYALPAAAIDAVSTAEIPSTLVPIPQLAPESVIEHSNTRTALSTEALVEISGSEIAVLHSYRQAGWHQGAHQQRLRASVLDRLRSAACGLPNDFGLAVFDAWRPLTLQRELFDAINPDSAGATDMVAPPSADPASPPPHLSGGAVDLTLSWQGTPLALGTGFDEFNDLTATRSFERFTGPVRALRRLLFHCLIGQDFVVLAEEWWHFEYGTRLWSAVSGKPVRYGPAGT